MKTGIGGIEGADGLGERWESSARDGRLEEGGRRTDRFCSGTFPKSGREYVAPGTALFRQRAAIASTFL